MKLHAKVRGQNGHVEHKKGQVQTDGTIIADNLPIAVAVEIVDEESGIYLYRYGNDGNCVGDTWHLTVAEAKNQAEFEYGIADNDWVEIRNKK